MRCACWLLPWLLAAPLWSQAQPSSQAPDAKQNEQSGSQAPASGTSKDRLFFTLPNFLTLENAANIEPLTTAEKFKVTARSSFDPVEYFWYGALAGIGQAENSESSFGQGAEGYAKRYGVQFADGTIENFMTKAILPSVLRQDPRYFQLGKGGFWHRFGYSAGRILITRSDAGTSQFNFSEVVGAAAAAGISTYSYHPRDDRTVKNAVDVWVTQLAYDTLSNVVKEFWPDIRRKMRKSKPAS